MSSDRGTAKERVRAHWEQETCGTRYGSAADRAEYFEQIRRARARLEPWIESFQDAQRWTQKRVLEIGVGAGSDFVAWIRAGAVATGVDLTDAAIARTRAHLEAEGFPPESATLRQADAERLPFGDASFDLVYSYGVLHHTPDTEAALRECRRVLARDGELRIMLYHSRSWTALMLWTMHCLLRGRPFVSPRRAVFEHLESPGTRCYSVPEARTLLEHCGFSNVRAELHLGPGDQLLIEPSARYRSPLFSSIWKFYPRFLVRALGNRFGLIMLLSAGAR